MKQLKKLDVFKSAVILAAGKATRMDGRSKGMVKIGDKPLISFGIDALIRIGIEYIYIIYRVTDEEIFDIKNYYSNDIKINFICDERLEGGVKSHYSFAEIVKYPMITLDCDLVFQIDDFYNMIKEGEKCLQDLHTDAVVTIIDNPLFGEIPMFKLENDYVVSYDHIGIDGGSCGGYIYGWKKNITGEIREYYEKGRKEFNSFFKYFVTIKNVRGMHIHTLWDVDTESMKEKSKEILLKQEILDVCN